MRRMIAAAALAFALMMPMANANAHPALCAPALVAAGGSTPVIAFMAATSVGFALVPLIALNVPFPTVYLGLTSYYGEADFPSGR